MCFNRLLFIKLCVRIFSLFFISPVLAKTTYSILNQNTVNIQKYIPAIDFALYALNEENAHFSNLVEGFIPIYQNAPRNLFFTDIRLYNPSGTPIEWNLSVGFRHLSANSSRLWGLYVGYDQYRSEKIYYFNQIHLGGEYWLDRLFLGGNIYIPIKNDLFQGDSLQENSVSYRPNITYVDNTLQPMPGIDGEVGEDVTPNLTVYAGGYYFSHKGTTIGGPKLRITYTIYHPISRRIFKMFDRIRLEGLISHDAMRGISWLIGLRFTFCISRSSNPTKTLARHMVDPLRRDIFMVMDRGNSSVSYQANKNNQSDSTASFDDDDLKTDISKLEYAYKTSNWEELRLYAHELQRWCSMPYTQKINDDLKELENYLTENKTPDVKTVASLHHKLVIDARSLYDFGNSTT